jgi:hypothetical protein
MQAIGTVRVTKEVRMIIPLYILYATPLFHGEQLGSGKAMKLMVSRAVARAAVNLSGFYARVERQAVNRQADLRALLGSTIRGKRY